MIRSFLVAALLGLVLGSMAQAPAQVSLVSELKPLRDIAALPVYREQTSIGQVSSLWVRLRTTSHFAALLKAGEVNRS